MINDFFKEQRELISRELEGFLGEEKKRLSDVPWGEDVCSRLLKFSLGGKMTRGGLVILSSKIFGVKDLSDAYCLARAIELFQSSFLIHDDIIDRDLVRRGEKTIHSQYQELGEESGFGDSLHFGESMGIGVGDIGFFLAFEVLSMLKVKDEVKSELIGLFAREMVGVGLGEMEDVRLGYDKEVSKEQVMQVYELKTARYTMSLPLMAGAILAGADQKTIALLEELGEDLGIIFQIKDDEMGIFGEEREIGKEVGGDIREGKKTLFYYYLFKMADSREKKKLRKIFGSEDVGRGGVNFVRENIIKLGVRDLVLKETEELAIKARKIIDGMDLKGKEPLYELVDLSLGRKR